MITTEIQKKIDEKWDACWPLSQLKPIIILDLISYLFFFKKVSENKLIFEETEKSFNPAFSNIEESEAITWEVFKNLDSRSMFEFFTQKDGVIDSLKNFRPGVIFNELIEGDLLLIPTPKLLAKSVEIIKILENEDANTAAAIFEYLLNKTEIIAPNGQIYLPHYMVDLIVSIIQPESKDVILDPAFGNGSLLVGCAKYIANENDGKDKSPIYNFNSQKLIGFESDLTNRRIGAMNMLLNGIENPNLKRAEPPTASSSGSSEKPTIIVSDLIFLLSDNTMTVEGDLIKEVTRKEILYLNYILKDTKPGVRLAIVVPSFILHSLDEKIGKIRQDIIDNFKLESIIYLEDKNFPHLFGAATLVFSREISTTTDKVWLYKIKQNNKSNKNLCSFNPGKNSIDTDEIGVIVTHFKNKSKKNESQNVYGIYVDAEEIKSKNYNFNYDEYNLFRSLDKSENVTEFNSEEKKISTNDADKYPGFVKAEKILDTQKEPGKKNIVLISIVVLALCLAFLGYWFFNSKKDLTIPKLNSDISTSNIDSAKDSTNLNMPALANTGQKINDEPDKDIDIADEKYKVISKAYFYSSPNVNSRENIYIDHWNNAILTAKEEKNGFIYSVYDNKMGQVLKGWLQKKDLEVLP